MENFKAYLFSWTFPSKSVIDICHQILMDSYQTLYKLCGIKLLDSRYYTLEIHGLDQNCQL